MNKTLPDHNHYRRIKHLAASAFLLLLPLQNLNAAPLDSGRSDHDNSIVKEAYKDGIVIRRSEWDTDDRKNGTVQYFYDNGRIKNQRKYENGSLLSEKRYDKNGLLTQHISKMWKVWEPWHHHRETHHINRKKENGQTVEDHYDQQGVPIKSIKYKSRLGFTSPLDAIKKSFSLSATGNRTSDPPKTGFKKRHILSDAVYYDRTGTVRLHKTKKGKSTIETRFYHVSNLDIKTEDGYHREKNSMYRMVWINGVKLGTLWARSQKPLNYKVDETSTLVFNKICTTSARDRAFHMGKRP
ncbi:MAG: hypothetical protein HUN04_11975 [Desulfobacter sp.]|nr:MAG: hypothetical protein HUN04_11975 [Desulfobacter sp.]